MKSKACRNSHILVPNGAVARLMRTTHIRPFRPGGPSDFTLIRRPDGDVLFTPGDPGYCCDGWALGRNESGQVELFV